MSHTNLLLGSNWQRCEWPDRVEVSHEGAGDGRWYAPTSDLTCELELTATDTASEPIRVYECDSCGKSCDAVWADDYAYCPYCGRLNTNRDVEVDE